MMGGPARAARLGLLAAAAALCVGCAALWFGVMADSVACWGFGGACLLQVPPTLSLLGRIQEGLGNRGLERDRLTLKGVSHLMGLLALGMALTAAAELMGERSPQASLPAQGLALLAPGLLAPIWYAKQRLADLHPALDLDAARTRTLLELAVMLLASSALSHWFPWADAITGLAMAVRLFFEGRSLARGTTLTVACGGCGTGCN